MTRKLAALLLAASAAVAAAAYTGSGQSAHPLPQSVPARPLPSNLILLDPAHGGPDSGASLGDNVREKDVTLAFAARLRSALAFANFNVASTRDSDPADALTQDQRAAIANRLHPLACLVLHATASGSGVHIYTSSLPSAPDDSSANSLPIPWESAQASSVAESRRLASSFGSALASAGISVVSANAAVAPLDNMMCPAVAVEVAPLSGSTATDIEYQKRIVAALTSAMRSWQAHSAPPAPTLPSRVRNAP